MNIKILIAPDYSPEAYIDWRLLSLLLQNELGRDVILLTAENNQEFNQIAESRQPEIIYSNPFDVIELTEKFNYHPIIKPNQKSDEVVLFSSIYGKVHSLSDLKKPCSIISLPNQELKKVSHLLLEAVDFTHSDIDWVMVNHLPAIMRKVGGLDVPVGAIYADYFYSLSPSRQAEFHVLIESKLEVIHHVFLLANNQLALKNDIQEALVRLFSLSRAQNVFHNLGWFKGLSAMGEEESLFFLDILRTLNQE